MAGVFSFRNRAPATSPRSIPRVGPSPATSTPAGSRAVLPWRRAASCCSPRDWGLDQLTVIDLASGETKARIPVGRQPTSVADHSGRVARPCQQSHSRHCGDRARSRRRGLRHRSSNAQAQNRHPPADSAPPMPAASPSAATDAPPMSSMPSAASICPPPSSTAAGSIPTPCRSSIMTSSKISRHGPARPDDGWSRRPMGNRHRSFRHAFVHLAFRRPSTRRHRSRAPAGNPRASTRPRSSMIYQPSIGKT